MERVGRLKTSLTALFGGVILLLTVGVFVPVEIRASTAVRGRCLVRCGIISEPRGANVDPGAAASLLQLAATVWDDLRYTKSLTGIDFQFVRIARRDDMTMDTLIEAYMEIGTTNVSAVFGPYRQALVTATQKFGIPYVVVDIGDTGKVTSSGTSGFYETVLPPVRPYNLISIVPHPYDLYSVIFDVLKSLKWPNVAVFYENGSDGVRLIEDLVRMPDVHVGAWKLDSSMATNDVTVRDALLQVRHLAMRNIVLMTSRRSAETALDTALHLSMLSYNYNWFITSMDLDDADLRRYAQTQVNLTTLKLQKSHLPNTQPTRSLNGLPDYAVVYDSLLTLYHGIKLHSRNFGSCHWAGKDHIVPTLTKIDDECTTGVLTFRSDGTRQGFIINVFTLSVSGLLQIGVWNSSTSDIAQRLVMDYGAVKRYYATELRHGDVTIGNLRVVTVLEAPYAMLTHSNDDVIDIQATGSSSRHQYHGYIIDLLDALSKRASFTYTLHVVSDGQRGQKRPDGTWTGLVGQLLYGNASLAVGPLTVTADRQEVVDFTQVFQTVELSAVVNRHQSRDQSRDTPSDRTTLIDRLATQFQFVRPLSGTLWLMLFAVVCSITLLLCIIDHLHSATSADPVTSQPQSGLGLGLGLASCLWCALTTMFLMTSSVHHNSTSVARSAFSRLTVTAVWCFSLFVVTSYTANMAALLTASRYSKAVAGNLPVLERLMTRLPPARWRFVTTSGGEVSALLHSGHGVIDHAFSSDVSTMLENGARWHYVNDLESGIREVIEQTGSMFIYDRSVLEYHLHNKVESHCARLETVPIYTSSDGVGYALAVPKRSTHTAALNLALSRLANDGTLRQLKHKWFGESNSPCEGSHDNGAPDLSEALTVNDLGGLFILLAIVIFALLIASVTDYCLKRIRTNQNHVTSDNRSKRSENHLTTTGLKGAPSNDRTTSIMACNSATSYDILQVEPYTESTVDHRDDRSSTRIRNCSLVSAKETNF